MLSKTRSNGLGPDEAERSGSYDTAWPFGNVLITAEALDTAMAETATVPARTNVISNRRCRTLSRTPSSFWGSRSPQAAVGLPRRGIISVSLPATVPRREADQAMMASARRLLPISKPLRIHMRLEIGLT